MTFDPLIRKPVLETEAMALSEFAMLWRWRSPDSANVTTCVVQAECDDHIKRQLALSSVKSCAPVNQRCVNVDVVPDA
jgi:hypothetical protein